MPTAETRTPGAPVGKAAGRAFVDALAGLTPAEVAASLADHRADLPRGWAFSHNSLQEFVHGLRGTRWYDPSAGAAGELVLVEERDGRRGVVREAGTPGHAVYDATGFLNKHRLPLSMTLFREACRVAFPGEDVSVGWSTPCPAGTVTLVWCPGGGAERGRGRKKSASQLHVFTRAWTRGWTGQLIQSIRDKAEALDYECRVTETRPGTNADLARGQWEEFVGGVVAAGGTGAHRVVVLNRGRLTDRTGVARLRAAGVSQVVITGAMFPLDGVSFVRQDDYAFGLALGRLVLADLAAYPAGVVVVPCNRRLVDPASLSPGRLRLKGLLDALASPPPGLRVADTVEIEVNDADYESALTVALRQTLPKTVAAYPRKTVALVALSHEVTFGACQVVRDDRHRFGRVRVYGSDLTDSILRFMVDAEEVLVGAVGSDWSEYAQAILGVLVRNWQPNQFRIVVPYALSRADALRREIGTVDFAKLQRVTDPRPR